MCTKPTIVALVTTFLLVWPRMVVASEDDNRLYNLEDAAGMFNERGYDKANSYSLTGNEIINDFNGNLIYTQRLLHLPISENGLHCDLGLAYNGNVSHVAFGPRAGANHLVSTPISHPEWILSINGIAVQTFNFENELISWRTITGGSDSISYNDDVASLIEGYHNCYRFRTGLSGGDHGVISILMADGSIREYYSMSTGIFGPANMIGGEYNSCSKDDPDRGYLWPGESPLYGYFTLYRSDGTRVLFKVCQPVFRTCQEDYPQGRLDYPRILLPVKFHDQMGHEISLSYIYKVDSDTVWGRPILSTAGGIVFDWSSWTPGTTNCVGISLSGNSLYMIYFADAVSSPGTPGQSGRGVSWRLDANRGLVWWIQAPQMRSTKFTYRSYSRVYKNMAFSLSERIYHLCGSGTKHAGTVYRVEPWRIWKIQYPEGGQEFIQYYKDPATAWGQFAYLGPKDTISLDYNHSEDCLWQQPPRFPCKKTIEFNVIGRDPFFLNMVAAVRHTLNGSLIINTDSLMFSWLDSLNDQSISSGDQFITERWFGKDSLDLDIERLQNQQVKSRTLIYRYYPEKGPFSSKSRDRGWVLKMVSMVESDRDLPGNQVTKNYYWNTECFSGVCHGTFLLDSLKTTHGAESYWEKYVNFWLGDPSSEIVNNLIRKDVIDPWGIRTETYYDTSFMRLGDSSTAYYNNGLVDSVLTKRISDDLLLRRRHSQYCDALAPNGYVGQLARTSNYLLNISGVTVDSMIECFSYYMSDAPSVMHRGATKWHIDPLEDTTFYYCSSSNEAMTYCRQAHDGTVDTITTSENFSDCGPYWFKKENHVGSKTLTWYRKVDGRGRLLWIVEPNRYRSEATYDDLNRVVKITLPGGYIPTSKELAPPDTAWSIWNLYDDEFVTDPVSVTRLIRVEKTQPARKDRVWIDGLSRSFRHDALNPDGSYDSVITSRDYAGRVASEQDQIGFITITNYDYLDRIVTTIYPDSAHSSDSIRYSVTNAQIVGLASMFHFPENILFAQEYKDENGNTVLEYYDVRDKIRLRRTHDGLTHLSTYFDYDDLGNLTLIIRPQGDSVRYVCNSLGQLIMEQAADYIDSLRVSNYGNITFKYDRNGNLIEKKDPNLSGPPFAFSKWRYNAYDAMNRLTESGAKVIMRSATYVPHQRNFYDQSISELSLGRLSLTFSLDPTGRCNYAERYHYDPRGRIKRQINYFNAVLDSTLIGGSEWLYTARGDSVVISYTYDWTDQCKSIIYPDGSVVKYKRDNRGRLTAVGGALSADSSKYAHIAYTHRGQIETMKLGGNLQQIDYLYNERRWLQSINGGTSSAGGAPGDIYGQAIYYYSHPWAPSGWSAQYNGNLFGQKISMLSQDTTFAYRYDESDRLEEVQRGNNPFESFSYDANGNFILHTKIIDGFEHTTSYVYKPGTNKLLVANNPTWMADDTLGYDANGNIIGHSRKKVSASYDLYNRMWRVQINSQLGVETVWYVYNADGERVHKAYSYHYRAVCGDPTSDRRGGPEDGRETTTQNLEEEKSLGGGGDPIPLPMCTYAGVSYTYYVVGQGQVLAEYGNPAQPNSPKARYIYAGGSRIAMRDAVGKLHYYLNDHLGSTRVVMDSTGLVKDKYWHYSYGESRYEQVNTNQAYRYTSKPLDKEGGINIYYYGARYYDPELGRFWAIDPAAGKYPGWSPYVYCADNPVRNVDRDGEDVNDVVMGAMAAIVDNALFINLRGELSPTDASDYDLGQDIGDAISSVLGAGEVSAGKAMTSGGATALAVSGGSAGEVALVASGAGVLLVLHGTATAASGGINLAMQKGRISVGGEKKPHGNTADNRPATLYERYDKEGKFLKHGVTKDPRKRYSSKELAGGKVNPLEAGPRKEMLKKERKRVEEAPGPLNKEPWAGRKKE